ncbi:MAG: hypothetical protein EA417_17565 [Gammaproteobacteria bacterium]|nr:MAG: hypothetical protein EA417_17565 [Gammaproteobacteria bacterium]
MPSEEHATLGGLLTGAVPVRLDAGRLQSIECSLQTILFDPDVEIDIAGRTWFRPGAERHRVGVVNGQRLNGPAPDLDHSRLPARLPGVAGARQSALHSCLDSSRRSLAAVDP